MDDIVDPNCIIKAFETTHISIFHDNYEDFPLLRATDVGKALELLNVYRTIQNFTSPKEKITKKCDTKGGQQEVVFLTSKGLYRLLYTCRKPIAERFRDWVGDILNDIIFNQSKELRCQLDDQIAHNAQLQHTLQRELLLKERAFTQCFNKRPVVYLGYVNENIVKFGVSDDIKSRVKDHKRTFPSFCLAWVVECKENRNLERALKSDVMLNNHRTTTTINNVTHNELFELKLGLTFEDIVNQILKLQSKITQDDNQNELLLKELENKREKDLKELEIKREKELKQMQLNHDLTLKLLEVYPKIPSEDLLNVLTKLKPDQPQTQSANVETEIN